MIQLQNYLDIAIIVLLFFYPEVSLTIVISNYRQYKYICSQPVNTSYLAANSTFLEPLY